MVSLKLQQSNIGSIDQRSTLYYGKYTYRARLTLTGLNRTTYAKTFIDFLKVIKRIQQNTHGDRPDYVSRQQQEIESIDLDSIERYIDWRNTHTKGANRIAMIRVEANTAGVFSNDLQLLQTLEKIAPGIAVVDYTEIDQSIPQGTKYYVKKPNHNYRVYVKSKRIEDSTKEALKRFIDRYKDTDTVVVPSGAFALWLNPRSKKTWYWNNNYLSSHYFLDFDQESTDTLFALMFGELIHRRFKLEKRPDPI